MTGRGQTRKVFEVVEEITKELRAGGVRLTADMSYNLTTFHKENFQKQIESELARINKKQQALRNVKKILNRIKS